jgi:colicin import membrane protein
MATATRDLLMPRPPGGMGAGAALALLVHAGLLVALSFSVRWKASEPAGVEAELWAAVPQIAAPPLVAPEPAPKPAPVERSEPPPPVPKAEPVPDPQIAIERARRERAEEERQKKEIAERERERVERDKAERERAEKARKEQALKEEQAVNAQREANLKRMQGLAGGTGAPGTAGTATQTAGPSAGYAGRIKARIKPNIVFAEAAEGSAQATVEVRLAPDGMITGRTLKKSSGVRAWDEAVLRAIDRTEVLPRDADGRVPPVMEITFRVAE